MTIPLAPGSVIIADLTGGVGGEQQGRRPAVVICSPDYLELMSSKAIVVPCTTRDRSWPNHLELKGATGLPKPTFAMSEQVTMIDRQRILRATGLINSWNLREIRSWVNHWMG